MQKSMRILLLSLLLPILVLSGCHHVSAGTNGRAEVRAKDSFEIRNGFYQMAYTCKDGFYYWDNKSFLHFHDTKANRNVYVCSKAGCSHSRPQAGTDASEFCDAYIDVTAPAFFVHDKYFYLIRRNMGQESNRDIPIMEKSDLDRSHKQAVKAFQSQKLSSFAIDGDKFYYIDTQTDMIKDDFGVLKSSAKTSNSFNCLDLRDGHVDVLVEPKEGISAAQFIIGKYKNKIYRKEIVLDKSPWDLSESERLDPASSGLMHVRYYACDTQTGQDQQVLSELDSCFSSIDRIVDGQLYCLDYLPKSDDAASPYALLRVDLDSGESKSIAAPAKEQILYGDGLYLFEQGETNNYCLYDCRKNTLTVHPKAPKDTVYPEDISDGLIFIWQDEEDDTQNCYALPLEDFLEGKSDKMILLD